MITLRGNYARALAICEGTGAVVIHSGSGSVYYPPDDKITLPLRKRFYDPAAYFNTRLRLTALWAERRMGWQGNRADGTLISVVAAYFLAEAAGIPVVDIAHALVESCEPLDRGDFADFLFEKPEWDCSVHEGQIVWRVGVGLFCNRESNAYAYLERMGLG